MVRKNIRAFILLSLACALSIGCGEKSSQPTSGATEYAATLEAKQKPFFQVVAASCAALLAVSHSQAVVEYLEKPIAPAPVEEFMLPVGAGGVRESIGKLLASATDKKHSKDPMNQKFILPTPVSYYESLITYDLEKLTKDDIHSYVSFIVKNEQTMTGYFRIPNGQFGQFVSARVAEDRYFYEIYSMDGSTRLGQGYWLD